MLPQNKGTADSVGICSLLGACNLTLIRFTVYIHDAY